MVVQAGAIIQTVVQARDAGWLFGVDWGARGWRLLAAWYRPMRAAITSFAMAWLGQHTGLEAVLADGTVISSMNQMLKNNAPYDSNNCLLAPRVHWALSPVRYSACALFRPLMHILSRRDESCDQAATPLWARI